MPKKNCVICGAEGYSYFPFCYKHLQDKNKGIVLKCQYCDEWFSTEIGCKCQKQNPAQEKTCEKCGKSSGKHNLCYSCYKKENEMPKIKEPEYAAKVIMKEIDLDNDVRKKWEAKNRCNDGHYVRSYSEVLIDNWLYDNRIVHAYEKKVYLRKNPNEMVLSDFFIPEGKVYIEFWGLDNNKYLMRKDEKLRLYADNDIEVINLEEKDIKNLDDIMPVLLYKYIKE